MWRFVSVGAPSEPVSLEQARRQCNMLADETEFDDKLALLITAGHQHVEKICGLYFGVRTAVLSCDGFSDFCRLPVAPISAVTSIAYVDPAGAPQVVSPAEYALSREDENGIEPAITPVYGVLWPAIQTGSQITLTVQAGFAVTPEPVRHAMLLWIADAFANREPAPAGTWTVIDSLLCNFRRGV